MLVGKVTPKGETTPRRKKSCCARSSAKRRQDVKDTRCACQSGIAGTVIDVKVFTREGIERDKRAH